MNIDIDSEGETSQPPSPTAYDWQQLDKDQRRVLPKHGRLISSARPGEAHKHDLQRVPRFRPIEIDSARELLDFVYTPLNRKKDEIRLLALIPNEGDDDSIVQCGLIIKSLQEDLPCYFAVHNAQGNFYLTSNIVLNKERKLVTTRLETFLQDFRFDRQVLLWIGEICLNTEDPDEVSFLRETNQEERIFSYSCRVLNMNDFTRECTDEQEYLQAPVLSTYRNPEPRRAIMEDSGGGSSKRFRLKQGQILPKSASLPYAYQPLDTMGGEIRLTILLPGKAEDLLVAIVVHASLHQPPPYQCLSYTWGDMVRTHRMLLDGHLFEITENLDQALRDIRNEHNEILIWIDAICINHSNQREMSYQIPRMHSIYKNAEALLIWIGPRTNDSDIAMQFISKIAVDRHQIKYEQSCREFAALVQLLDQPYFNRLWIIQEVAVGSNLTVYCGRKTVSWLELHDAAFFVGQHFSDYSQQPNFDQTLSSRGEYVYTCIARIGHLNHLRYHHENGGKASLLHLALLTRTRKCFDPRDKLYGLWALASDTPSLNIPPDYTSPIVNIYMDFVRAHISHYRSLDIICAAEPQESTLGLPSWCPDWRHKPGVCTLIHREWSIPNEDIPAGIPELDSPYFASRGIKCHSYNFAHRRPALICTRLYTDTIEIFPQIESVTNIVLDGWLDLVREFYSHFGIDDVDEKFWSTLTGSRSGGVSMSFTPLGRLRTDLLLTTDTISTSLPEAMALALFKRMKYMLQRRVLVITGKSYLGLAPLDSVDEGLEVCVLAGCSVPVLLQHMCGNAYKFKGSVYVQGWMNGEMLESMGTEEDIARNVAVDQIIALV